MLDCADVQWDVDTASGGTEALQLLAEKPADVIVSDMKMRGMDGAQLLTEVRKLYPATVRIVLSGQSDKDAVYRAVPPMHQYLSKPCPAETLKTTITRSCALGQFLNATSSQEIIGRITSLPSLPARYLQVVAEIESNHGTVASVGKLISQDPAMTAKTLQLANSAIFGQQANVTSPAQAVSLIGMDALKSLVLSLSVFQSFRVTDFDEFNIDKIAEHSLQVGTLARHISQLENANEKIASEAFTSGLLHDVGKLILATFAKSEFTAAIAKSKSDCIPLVEAEKEVFGLGHDGIGGHLLSLWGLPPSIVESVLLHHSPDQIETHEVPALVYIANHLSKSHHTPAQQECFDNFIAARGLNDRIKVWRNL